MGYIMLYITQSGNLNIQIDGSSTTGFLDVAIFNIHAGSNTCTAVQNVGNEIGCNYATYSSGCNQFGNAFGCISSVPAPAVTAGQVLMILVENWSGSSNNFTLQMGTTPGSASSGIPNANINPAGPFCSTSGATQLTAGNNGGTWSGPGTSASGMFNPATAGIGTHTINYTIGTAPCISTSSTTIQVVSTPSITVSSATICPGGSATLTATPNAAGGTYVWNPGGLTGQSITVSPGTTSTYTCTYSIGSCVSAPRTATVTIGGAVTLSVNSATVCPGSSATLTASGGSGYTWAPATGLSATTGTTVTANPTTTTTYTVSNGGACVGSATSTVTVSPGPTVTVNSPTICVGANTVLTATGATTYTWSPPGGLSATTGFAVTANPTVTTTYTVVGSSAASCTGTITSTVTVNPLPVVAVNSPTICVGSSATLTATGATTYSWTPATGLSATSGALVTANPLSTTTYTITGTTAGCNGTVTSTVTVNPIPTITALSGTVCPTMTCSITAAGATTYSWSPATGLNTTTGVTVLANPPVTTTYTITGTSLGCNGTGTTTVTVQPLPVITANSPTTCAGSPVAVNASGGNIYVWQSSADLSGTGGTAMANPATTTSYTVLGTDSNGCAAIDTFIVTVNPLPVVTVNTGTICAGASTTLTANGGTTYAWDPPAGLSATTGASVTANPTATTIYTVTGTTNGCNGIQTTTVTVNPIPVITVNSPGICVSGTATITASGATTYSWSPATGLSATTGASVTANPTATTIYTVTGTSLGCDGTAVSTVTINAIPVVAVNSPPVCIGSSVILNATGGTSFTWAPATGLSGTNGASVSANPLVTTIYTVTETSSGCNGTNTSTVIVNPLPTVTAGNTGPYCPNGTIQLNCTSSSGAAFAWTGPGTYGTGSEDPVISNASVAHSGIYSVTVTDTNTCVNIATTQVVVNPSPTVVVNNNSPVCLDGTVHFTASGGSQFSWAGPGGFTATAFDTLIPAASMTAGSYTVVVTDNNGCVNANVTSVTINPNPPAPGTPGATSYCVNDVAQALTAIVPSGATLNWYGTNPSGSYSAAATVPSTSAAGMTTYYVSQSIAGCEGPQSAITILVRPLPTATLTAVAAQCVPFNGSFSLNSASTIVSYVWNMGNGNTNTISNTLNWSYGESGTYDVAVTITDNNSCINTMFFDNHVHVNEIPTAEFIWSPSPVSILEPNVTFYSYSTGSNLSSYEWNIYHYDTLLYSSDDEQPTYVFTDVDTFHVQLTVVSAHGCTNTTVKPLIIQDDHAVFIPNAFSPDNDNINEEFKVYGTGIKKVIMTIFDRWGGVIFRTDEADKGWNGRSANDNRVEKGVYIYKAEIVDYKGVKTLRTGHVTVVR
jgi:gliding motility-associated-like protein